MPKQPNQLNVKSVRCMLRCITALINIISGGLYRLYATQTGVHTICLLTNVPMFLDYPLPFWVNPHVYPIKQTTLWYTNIAMENHHFKWVNQLYKWQFSKFFVCVAEGMVGEIHLKPVSQHPLLSMGMVFLCKPFQPGDDRADFLVDFTCKWSFRGFLKWGPPKSSIFWDFLYKPSMWGFMETLIFLVAITSKNHQNWRIWMVQW